MNKLTIEELSAMTDCGYSFSSYGRIGWNSAIKFLMSIGLDDTQIKVFMLSKHTRWAGDLEERDENGSCNGETVKDYLKDNRTLDIVMRDLIRWA